MLDVLMIIILAACFGSIFLWEKWCQAQVDHNE